MGSENPRIRNVVSADVGDILRISQCVWEGHDYLPHSIHAWLEDPCSFTFGIPIGETLIALANLRIIEDGKTGWMEGLRVHPDHRGKGFADALTRHVIRKARELQVQRLRYTTSDENEASLRLAEKFGFLKTLRMEVFLHSEPKLAVCEKLSSVSESNPVEVHALLKELPHIIPANMLICDWKALDNSLRNLRVLGKDHTFYTARQADGGSVSFGRSRRQKDGSMWAFTIYASEPTEFLQQLHYNAGLAAKGALTSFMGTCETRFREALIRSGVLSSEDWATGLILVEKSLLQD